MKLLLLLILFSTYAYSHAEVMKPLSIGIDPATGANLSLVTGDWLAFQMVHVAFDKPTYLKLARQDSTGFWLGYTSTELNNSAQFQVWLSINEEYGRTFHMRDGEHLYFTRMDQTCPSGCLIGNDQHVNLPYLWWWAGEFSLVPAAPNSNTFHLQSNPGYNKKGGYLSWPNGQNINEPFRVSSNINEAAEFRVHFLPREDHRSAPQASVLRYDLPSVVTDAIETSSYVAETLRLVNNATETNQIEASISFSVQNAYKFLYHDSFSRATATNIRVSIPFLSAIVGLDRLISFAHVTGTTSETEQSRSKTVTGSIVAHVDPMHTAFVSVVAHTAKVNIPWSAIGTRYLLNRVGNPLLDVSGNVIPLQDFASSGILITKDYYSYDSAISVIPPNATMTKKCGPMYGEVLCDDGYCCGEKGFCGKGVSFCSIGCQRAYGTCHLSSDMPVDCMGGERMFWTHECLLALANQSECVPAAIVLQGSQSDRWINMLTAADIKMDMKSLCDESISEPAPDKPSNAEFLWGFMSLLVLEAVVVVVAGLAWFAVRRYRDRDRTGAIQIPTP